MASIDGRRTNKGKKGKYEQGGKGKTADSGVESAVFFWNFSRQSDENYSRVLPFFYRSANKNHPVFRAKSAINSTNRSTPAFGNAL